MTTDTGRDHASDVPRGALRIPVSALAKKGGQIVAQIVRSNRPAIITKHGTDLVTINPLPYNPAPDQTPRDGESPSRQCRFVCASCGAQAQTIGTPDELADDLTEQLDRHTTPGHIPV